MKYGLLTILSSTSRQRYFLCRCDCGIEKEIRIDHIRAGKTISCGCEAKKRASARIGKVHKANITHNACQSRAYTSWCGMKQRCYNPKSKFFSYYGGRGITICDQWRNDFSIFLLDMGERPKNTTIERVDNNFGYFPGNCIWASRKKQQNNRRVNKKVTFNEITKNVSEWAESANIHRNTLQARLDKGFKVSKALNPEKMRDLSGLKLGGAANGARQRAKTHCKWGHEFTKENTYVNKKGNRRCNACRRKSA